MKLEDMRKIAEARTKGEWKATGFNVDSDEFTVADCFSTKNGNEDNNAKFIAMCGNNIDCLFEEITRLNELSDMLYETGLKYREENKKLLKVVEAAKKQMTAISMIGGIEAADELKKALDELTDPWLKQLKMREEKE